MAVRSGGHSVAGQSSNDDGLVIDVRPMKLLEIDPTARWARVGAGCTWADFDAAAQAHGLATTGGRVSTTGVVGLTLGGGSGWLERKYGLACDNLLAVELTTADGREIRADAMQNQDLLWACKGGGGNFGVVTALEFMLHPVGPTILGGLVAWPAASAPEIARAYRDWADSAPEKLGSGLVVLSGPPEDFVPAHLQNEPIVAIVLAWTGDNDTGADFVQVMRDLKPASTRSARCLIRKFSRCSTTRQGCDSIGAPTTTIHSPMTLWMSSSPPARGGPHQSPSTSCCRGVGP